MLHHIKKMILCVAVTLGLIVFSLSCDVYAAEITVLPLDPLVSGVRTPTRLVIDDNVGSNGDIYIADPRSGGVLRLNQYGELTQQIKTPISADSVAVLSPKNTIPGGKLLVGMGKYVAVYNQDGIEVAKLGSGLGQFVITAGMAVDAATGEIYVVDAGTKQVKKFNAAGEFVLFFGSLGSYDGQFKLPVSVAVVTETTGTRIAVVDALRGNVQFFSKDGSYIKTIGSGTASTSAFIDINPPLVFNYPVSVAFEYLSGAAYRMYVLDMYQGQIQVIDPITSEFIAYAGIYGSGAELGSLLTPSDIQFDAFNKRLLIANGLSNIASYGVDGGSNPSAFLLPRLTIDIPVYDGNNNMVTLTGTVDDNCTVAGAVNTKAVAGAIAPVFGKWSLTVNNLQAGKNIISVRANFVRTVNGVTRVISGTSTQTTTITYTPPTVSLKINDYLSLTTQSTLILSGITDVGAKVEVVKTAVGIATSPTVEVTDVAWSSTPITLGEGDNIIRVSASKDGLVSNSKDLVVTLDSLPPELKVSTLNSDKTINSQTLSIQGTVADPHSPKVTVAVNKGNSVELALNGKDNAFATLVTLDKGSNNIKIIALDSLGNLITDERTIIYDPLFSAILVLTPVDGSSTNIRSITVSGVLTVPEYNVPIKEVRVAGAIAVLNGLSWSSTVNLTAGRNSIEVDAIDLNDLIVSAQPLTILYDNQSPILAVISPTSSIATNKPNLIASIQVSDNDGTAPQSMLSATLTSSVSFELTQPVINNCDQTTNKCDVSIVLPVKQEGTYNLVITAKDKVGNVSSALRTFIYDTTPPVFSVNLPADPYPSILNGTLELGATVGCKDTTGPLGVVTVDKNTWKADLSGREYDYRSLSCVATDAANNTTEKTINLPDPDGLMPEVTNQMEVKGLTHDKVTIQDALAVFKLIISKQAPTTEQLTHGDVGPLVQSKTSRNGKLDLIDAILILRKALGLSSWQ